MNWPSIGRPSSCERTNGEQCGAPRARLAGAQVEQRRGPESQVLGHIRLPYKIRAARPALCAAAFVWILVDPNDPNDISATLYKQYPIVSIERSSVFFSFKGLKRNFSLSFSFAAASSTLSVYFIGLPACSRRAAVPNARRWKWN